MSESPGKSGSQLIGQPESGNQYEARIAKLQVVLYAASLVFAGLGTALVGPFDLNTPIAPVLAYVAAAVTFLSSTITQILKKAAKGFSPKFLFWLLICVNLAYLGLAAILWFTSSFDVPLTENVPEEEEIPAGSEETFGFTVEPGDFVIVRVFTLTPDLDVTVRVFNDERKLTVEKVEDRLWELKSVLVGGDWTMTVTDNTGSGGDVRVRYNVSRKARDLELGASIRGQVIAEAGNKTGYVIKPEEDVEAELVADDLIPSDLPLGISVFAGSTLVNLPATLLERSYTVPIPLRSGTTYVVAVGTLEEALGRFTISLGTTGVEPPPSTTTTSTPIADVALPDLYGLSEADAYSALGDLGLSTESISVCSSSVDAGMVRQAFVRDDDGTERVVSDEPGTVPEGVLLPQSAVVILKISNGSSCD